MKPIERVATSKEDWEKSEAKAKLDAEQVRVETGRIKYEQYLKAYNDPKAVAKREVDVERRRLKQIAYSNASKKMDAGEKVVNNQNYFFMIENQIRKQYPVFEVEKILPLAEEILKTSNIKENELEEYPVEGYYYKSALLKRFFKIVRNLQENGKLWPKVNTKDSNFLMLKNLMDLELFGKVESDKHNGTAILPRRYDILALSARDEKIFKIYSSNPGWDIPKIVDNLQNHFTDTPNLVELAYLTGELEPLICGAETNALYRDLVRTKGMRPKWDKNWQVDEAVEKMGNALVEEYNGRFGLKIIAPTPDNNEKLFIRPERPRVAILGQIIQTATNYFWKSDELGRVTDIYTKEFITTETEKKRLYKEED